MLLLLTLYEAKMAKVSCAEAVSFKKPVAGTW
jgi:hypothetical protein